MKTAPPLSQRQSELLAMQPIGIATRLFALDDPHRCYRVDRGEVMVFAARMGDGLPLYNRTKIGEFAEGEFIFSGAPMQPDTLPVQAEIIERERAQGLGFGLFMSVPDDTDLSVLDKDALLSHAELVDTAEFAVDNWVAKIIDRAPPSVGVAEFPVLRLDGEEREEAVATGICMHNDSERQVLWLQFGWSEGRGDDASPMAEYRGFEINAAHPLAQSRFPLFGRDLAAAHPGVVVGVAATETLLRRGAGGALFEEFDRFAKTLLYLQALRTERIQRQNIERAKEIEKQNLTTMLENFRNAFRGREDIVPHTMLIDRTSITSNLLLELCKITRSDVKRIDTQLLEAADLTTPNGIDRLLSLGGFDSRTVTLEKNWRKRNSWTKVAWVEGQSYPVLLQGQSGLHKYYDPQADEWRPVTREMEAKVNPEAVMVYRRLGESIDSLGAFLRQALRFSQIDLTRICVTALGIAAITLVNPIILSNLISKALPNFDFVLLNSYLLALFAAALGMLAANAFNSIALIRIESSLSLDMHAALWGRLLRLPMTFFSRHTVGDLSSRANIFDDLQAAWTSSTANIISSSVALVFNLGLLFYYSWRLAFIIVAAFSLFVLLVWVICRRVMPLIADMVAYRGKIDGLIFQLLHGVAKLRVAAKEYTALALWSNLYNKQTVTNRRYMLTNSHLQVVASVLPLGGSILIFSFIYFGLIEAGYQEDFDLGDFILFNTAFGQVTATVTSLSLVLLSVISTAPMARRMTPILTEPVEVSAQKPQMPVVRGNIRFEGVEFHYQEDIPILKGISLEINEGEYAAIVGRSGSGKSTLFNLLLGFQQPQQGAVLVDDTNVNDIDISDLRQRIGVVLQHGAILPGSLYENIACENPNVTLKAAWAAAERAGLKQDIQDLPMGMHTLLSSFGGGGLSGGQLQRVRIARALAHNPSILLFDEATSALDNVTQKIVQDHLTEMNITRVIIAHRLSTISNADRIYVMDQGQIVEQGGYQELLERRGLFYQLAVRQMQLG